MMVKKASGALEPYSRGKLLRSCVKAGLNPIQARQVASQVERNLYDGVETREIYRLMVDAIKKLNPATASKYTLKQAIMSLGPTGFPFETYVCRILEAYGYRARLRTKIKGRCVEHEVDVLAEKQSLTRVRIMVECKYHNAPGVYTGLKETMYTYARFLDLQEGCRLGLCEPIHQAWLVSNTKCSEEAKAYAKCQGLTIIAWKYPPDGGLEKMVQRKKLYPITILGDLSPEQLERLSENHVMLTEDLIRMDAETLAKSTHIPMRKILEMKRFASTL